MHLRALGASAEVEPAAVVEPSVPARGTLADAGVPVYRNVEQLLSAGGFDGVLIAAGAEQHAALVATFAAAGVPVLCEQPLGAELTDAVEATRAASDAGIVLQVGYWPRFAAALLELRAGIEAGELGRVERLSCAQRTLTQPLGVGEIDVVRWLSEQELGSLSSARRPGPAAVTLVAELSRGATATITLGRPPAGTPWVEVWGTEDYAAIPFPDGEGAFLDALVAQAEAFARAIDGEHREGAGGDDAIAAHAVAERVAAVLRDVTR
jgi:predicted dehydrogenase